MLQPHSRDNRSKHFKPEVLHRINVIFVKMDNVLLPNENFAEPICRSFDMAQCGVSVECDCDLQLHTHAHEPDAKQLIRDSRPLLTEHCFLAMDAPIQKQLYRIEKYVRRGFSFEP